MKGIMKTIEIPELDKIPLPQWLEITLYNPLQKKEISDLIDNHVWVTARRVQIPVRQMQTSHIVNCIKCFNGQGKSHIPYNYLGGKEKWLKIFNNELKNRQ